MSRRPLRTRRHPRRLGERRCRAARAGRSRASTRSISSSVNPVPTLPAQRRPSASLTREHERAEPVRAPSFAARVAGNDELLTPLRLHFSQSRVRFPGWYARANALGDDALETLLLGGASAAPPRRRTPGRSGRRARGVEELREHARGAPRSGRAGATRRPARERRKRRRRASRSRLKRAEARRARLVERRRSRRRAPPSGDAYACPTARATVRKRPVRSFPFRLTSVASPPRTSRARESRPTSPRRASPAPVGRASTERRQHRPILGRDALTRRAVLAEQEPVLLVAVEARGDERPDAVEPAPRRRTVSPPSRFSSISSYVPRSQISTVPAPY